MASWQVYKSTVTINILPHKNISCQHDSENQQQNEIYFSHRSPRAHPSLCHCWGSGNPCSSLELSQALTIIFACAQVAPSSGASYCPPVPTPVSLVELFKSLALTRINHDLPPAFRFALHLGHLDRLIRPRRHHRLDHLDLLILPPTTTAPVMP